MVANLPPSPLAVSLPVPIARFSAPLPPSVHAGDSLNVPSVEPVPKLSVKNVDVFVKRVDEALVCKSTEVIFEVPGTTSPKFEYTWRWPPESSAEPGP